MLQKRQTLRATHLEQQQKRTINTIIITLELTTSSRAEGWSPTKDPVLYSTLNKLKEVMVKIYYVENRKTTF